MTRFLTNTVKFMCGIVGYIGKQTAFPILLKGLYRLEYRGYDSAGVALINQDDNLQVYKVKGKVSELENETANNDLSGCLGIGHTRWATHGEPNQVNAHPHCSQSGNLALVHNGIIENYATLKKKLQAKGFTFKSETDTEVLVQLIEYILQNNDISLMAAVQYAMHVVIGAYSIAVLQKNNPDEIVVAKKSSPLIIGIGKDNDYYIASDATPIVEYTDRVVYLKDEEVACINRKNGLRIENMNNEKINAEVKKVTMDIGELEKQGFPHFMLKEIFDQPQRITDCMRGRVNPKTLDVVLSAVSDHKERLLNTKRIIIIACGTSWHAGLIGKRLLEDFCHIPVEVAYASEFRYSCTPIDKDVLIIALSQSGETADTLAAVQLAHDKGAFIYGICNTIGSSIPRNTDTGSYIHVGPEIGVASTKAFTGQVTVLTMLALVLAREKKTMNKETYKSIVKELLLIPERMEEILKIDKQIEELAKSFTFAHNFIYMGRGYGYPVALEGALKLKEISYIHAEGYPAAEMKHGPIALIDNEMPVVIIATHTDLYDKVISNIQEIKARKGRIIAIVTQGDKVVKNIADITIEIPPMPACLEPLISTIPLQLLAYHVAVCKDLNVDQPRNLAKSVTVE